MPERLGWTLPELLFELEQDPNRRILFVEGERDVAFWRDIVPTLERRDTAIYPIAVLVSAETGGGERGRLIACARAVADNAVAIRIRFFTDADCDRILGVTLPKNISLTDGRDLESYGLNEKTMERLCVTGFTRTEAAARKVLPKVESITRPIGLLRIASARHKLNLPFQRTIEKNGLRKFVIERQGGDVELNEAKLITTLLQNCRRPTTDRAVVVGYLNAERAVLAQVPDFQIIHGKDFTYALARIFDIEREQVERLLFLSLDRDTVRTFPNISALEAWFKTAA